MSANQSDLSNAHYGYDMVLATTQASVNATMEEWLDKQKDEPFIQAYVYNPDHPAGQSGATLVDFTTLVSELGFDPFTVPNDTPTTDPRVVALQEQKFMYAFKTQIGIPDFPLEDIPPVISFDQEGSYVTYNMVCKTFQIIEMEPALYGSVEWLNLNQADQDKPWVFSFTVDLDLRNDNINNHFHDLPITTQNEIKNLGEDMFSVQQLFLDLNQAGLTNTVAIVGLPTNSQAYIALTTVFLNTYLAELSKDGGIMLGLGVVSSQPFPQNVSLIPTNLNFEVSSYKDSSGKATTDYPAYTLNYLVMAKGHPMPAPAQFTWNWVEKDKVSQYAGVMAINRDTFTTFLHDLLSPSLYTICKQPTAQFDINLIKATVHFGYTAETGPLAYNTVANGGAHVLTFSYSKSASDSDTFIPNWGNFGVDYTVTSDVYLEGTTIRVETNLNMHCHLNVDGGVTDGNWASYASVTTFTIGVDTHGMISVSQSAPVTTDNSQKPDPGWWSELISLGTIDSVVDSIASSLKGWLSGFITSDAGSIETMLNGSNTWVFPGSSTFTFTNAAFSDNQDLVSNVIYIAPTAAKK